MNDMPILTYSVVRQNATPQITTQSIKNLASGNCGFIYHLGQSESSPKGTILETQTDVEARSQGDAHW